MTSKPFVFRFDDVLVREREFLLVKADQALTLEPKAFRVLLFLLRNPQRLVSKEELLNAAWGDIAVGEGSLTRCIWLLRNALGDDTHGTRSRYIETVPTVGYRFMCKVEASEDTSGEPESAGKSNGVSSVGAKVRSRVHVGSWVLTGGVILALGAGVAFWYLHSSLPPLRVTGTNPITHDGHGGLIAGTDGARIYFNSDASSSEAQEVSVSGGGRSKRFRLGLGICGCGMSPRMDLIFLCVRWNLARFGPWAFPEDRLISLPKLKAPGIKDFLLMASTLRTAMNERVRRVSM